MRPSPARTGFTGWVENLAREQTDGLVAVALHAGLSADDAIDAMREAFTTFLSVPQARTLAEHREDTGTVLAVLLRHAVRHLHRQSPLAQTSPAPEQVMLDDTPSVATLIAAAEQHLVMLDCVRKLAEIQRSVVELRMIEEISGSEAARPWGLRPDAIAGMLHRAKAELQRCLTE
jgi:RNA polymerase sigma-70 factor, ECF subfamily